MSPWNEKTSPAWPLYAGIALILAAAVSGLLLLLGVVDSDDEPREAGPTPAPSATATQRPTPPRPSGTARSGDGLEVVSWGEARGQLAVLVRNASDRHVEHARVRITAKDAAGAVLLSTTGSAGDVCCSAAGLPPGGELALFADPAPAAGRIRTVEVDDLAAETRPATDDEPSVRAGRPVLTREADDTVVTVALTLRGASSGYVAAQAVLVDDEDRPVQVISGRFYCFEPGTARTVRMQLFHAVPPGLRVGRVLAQPLPDDTPGIAPGRCR